MIFKNQIKEDFSIIPNQILTDNDISMGAKLVYLYISSKPQNWNVVHSEVQESLKIKSHNTLAGYFKELIAGGWVSRVRKVSKNNKLNGGYDYTIHITKQHVKKAVCGKIDMSKIDIPLCQKTPYAGKLTSSNTEIDNIVVNTESNNTNIPLTPLGGKMESENFGHPPNLITNSETDDQPYQSPPPATEKQQDMAVNAWLTIIKNKRMEFTKFETRAIIARAMQYPKMQVHEIESELYQIDKWAWEGFDIEDALRCGYRKIQSFRKNLRKRIVQDKRGNPILLIDDLNKIRINTIKKEKEQVAA